MQFKLSRSLSQPKIQNYTGILDKDSCSLDKSEILFRKFLYLLIFLGFTSFIHFKLILTIAFKMTVKFTHFTFQISQIHKVLLESLYNF